MSSTRLPGKIMQRVAGRTLLEWHVERLKRCPAAAEVVVATTANAGDEIVVAEAKRLGVRWYCGSEDDVLERFLGAAREAKAEAVARVTSDCPLWDPGVGAQVVAALTNGAPVDYAAVNSFELTYPRGLDTEVFWMDVLERLARLAPPGPCPEREHVTYLIEALRSPLFLHRSVVAPQDGSDLRWCVDTADDLACISAIYHQLSNPFAAYPEVLALVRSHPEIARLNAQVEQKKR
jgi:spore coat polysaccharide biosynthesis protein SpsF